jgi:hypothetical protein
MGTNDPAKPKTRKDNTMPTKEKLEKELHRLQRDLNSHRLMTYIPGDTSEEETARQRERASKLARFYEILNILKG